MCNTLNERPEAIFRFETYQFKFTLSGFSYVRLSEHAYLFLLLYSLRENFEKLKNTPYKSAMKSW